MRLVIQRVLQASVEIDGITHGQIASGLLLLLGINDVDTKNDADYLAQKVMQMRIFGDDAGKMNLSVTDTGGEILIISQFTLFANTKKGNRPSFIQAARPEKAIPLYNYFIEEIGNGMKRKPETGIFGADMKVSLVNDGPVTIVIDSQNKDL